ncbi:triose-phosphate isomerase [Sphingosinicella soli]|uniref:Triosephosphate isomerase n=1 Tax=Sphingosinicella soli TaxID=333708 RepID=A0A7W7AY00_9SPHN|nr:triose-phosphate isomerase [Sphingosinicella soli]MBB4630476.1 triosephosphate isomerase [Sphingosinicella soli]
MDKPMLVAGNWKMNGLQAALAEVEAIARAADGAPSRVEVAVAPPFTLIARAKDAAAGSRLRIGGQDCHANPSGAHTGCISATMLADLGCDFAIVGHSERRTDNGETDAIVKAKATAAIGAGLRAILCVGETEAERDAGRHLDVVGAQLVGSLPDADPASVVIAYEPVWAIGTGRTPRASDVDEMHSAIRARLVARYGEEGRGILILYGGSVKPSNAAELFAVPEVGGALVGGASLKAADFLPIIAAA